MPIEQKDFLGVSPNETEQITFEMLEELSNGKGEDENE